MIGKNKLILNQATMRAAVEMYLDSQRAEKAPRQLVECVSFDHRDGEFHVALETVEPEAGGAS